MMDKKEFVKRHPVIFLVVVSIVAGIIIGMCGVVFDGGISSDPLTPEQILFDILLLGSMIGVFYGVAIILPVLLLVIEVYTLVRQMKGKNISAKIRYFDLTAILLGISYNILFLSYFNATVFHSDWNEVLYNTQTHTPIFTESYLTIWVIICVGILGYLFVSFVPLTKMPPLAFVLGFSAMYLGTAISIIWAVQINIEYLDLTCLILILPICCICMTARTILCKVREWKELDRKVEAKEYGTILALCNRWLDNSNRWPIAAFLFMWPLLGILIGVLMLFGQKPDAIIRAWTETSDWNLSQRTAPQNLYKDEHYLCTVAAGGHEEIVKPIRLGVRHGHEVIVNRQLCVANAFEQILEERWPRFHKVVRSIYDDYGFPVARLIKSKWAADVVYVLMKPAEWFFLVALYLVDVNPENRIAIQYTGKGLEYFLEI